MKLVAGPEATYFGELKQFQEKWEPVFRPELRESKNWIISAVRRKAEMIRIPAERALLNDL